MSRTPVPNCTDSRKRTSAPNRMTQGVPQNLPRDLELVTSRKSQCFHGKTLMRRGKLRKTDWSTLSPESRGSCSLHRFTVCLLLVTHSRLKQGFSLQRGFIAHVALSGGKFVFSFAHLANQNLVCLGLFVDTREAEEQSCKGRRHICNADKGPAYRSRTRNRSTPDYVPKAANRKRNWEDEKTQL